MERSYLGVQTGNVTNVNPTGLKTRQLILKYFFDDMSGSGE